MSNDAATNSAKELNNARKESLRKAMGSGKSSNNNDEGQSNPDPKKEEKKLDNDEKNSYINNNSEDDTTDNPEQDDKYTNIFESQFKGDPKKVVKSWSETQSYAAQLRQQVKELQNENDSMFDVLERNPELANIVERAAKGEDVKSFLRGKEPQGKPDSSQESKLNSSKNIPVEELAENGYIRPSELEYLTESQKAEKLLQARLRYMEDTLPSRIAEKTATEYQRRIEEQTKQQEKQRTEQETKKLNNQRWKSGIETVVETYGLDFAGKDQDLLDQIEKHAKYIRDPENPNVIDEDSVYLATQRVMRLNGRDATPKDYNKPKQDAKQKVDENFGKGFNTSKRTDPPKREPTSLAEKLRERRLAKETEKIKKRNFNRRTDINGTNRQT